MKFDWSVSRPFLGLTFPLVLGTQMENLVAFAEIFMVRSLGPDAISAVGVSRTIVFVFGITMIAVATGTMAMVAQAVGAKDEIDASETAKQSVTLVLLVSSVISLLGYVTADVALRSLSVPEAINAHGVPYLQVFFASLPMMALRRTLDTCLHAAGDTRTPLYISIAASVIHLVTAYALIGGHWGLPTLGVPGAAVGGLITELTSNVIRFAVLYSGQFGFTFLPSTSYLPTWDRTKRILKIGIPSALQGLFRNGSNVVYVKLVAITANPTVALAAYSVGSQMERTVRRTSLAFGTATTSVIGRTLGAGDPEAAEAQGWSTMIVSVGTLVLVGIPIFFFADLFMQTFVSEADVINVGVQYLVAIILAEPFMCAAIASQGSLRGAGDSVPPLVYTIMAQWLVRLPCAYALAFPFGYDIVGIWAALVIFSTVQGVLTVRKFAQGHWKHRTI